MTRVSHAQPFLARAPLEQLEHRRGEVGREHVGAQARRGDAERAAARRRRRGTASPGRSPARRRPSLPSHICDGVFVRSYPAAIASHAARSPVRQWWSCVLLRFRGQARRSAARGCRASAVAARSMARATTKRSSGRRTPPRGSNSTTIRVAEAACDPRRSDARGVRREGRAGRWCTRPSRYGSIRDRVISSSVGRPSSFMRQPRDVSGLRPARAGRDAESGSASTAASSEDR